MNSVNDKSDARNVLYSTFSLRVTWNVKLNLPKRNGPSFVYTETHVVLCSLIYRIKASFVLFSFKHLIS